MLNLSTYLTPQERAALQQKSDWRGFLEIAHTWAWIAATFTLVAYFPNIFTIILALFILGGKQLACAVIMHDTGHHGLFKSKKLNDFFGTWFGAYPVMNDMLSYRHYHVKHHLTTGTAEDPDISLTKGYPTTAVSMMRKLGRDLAGATGLKHQLGLLMMHLGYWKYTGSKTLEKLYVKDRTWAEFFKLAWKKLHGPIISNGLLFSILWLTGNGWLYLLWIGAMFTTYNFSVRIRSIAEHSMLDASDNLRNTRTTYANWFERILFAPHHVNYHVEHHLMMAVPPYHLPKMHKLLKERGFYEKGVLAQGYGEILRLAIR
ncbi:MAG: fatty acid desaturase family protein [Saprospiraceae bacterium]